MKPSHLGTLLILLTVLQAPAAGVRIKTATLAGVALQDRNGTPLDAGRAAAGDGCLLEFGYYSLASTAVPFSGEWNPLTGPDSESGISTTIGAELRGDGTYSFAFELSTALTGLPADGTPLVIRFYDATTVSGATDFNAVSNTTGIWNWDSNAVQINMGVGSDPGTVWQGGPGSEFRTTIPVPEPAATLLIAAGAGILLFRRRERKRETD